MTNDTATLGAYVTVLVHRKSPKPMEMTLTHLPLRIWLTRNAEVIVERKARLGHVARIVRIHWAHLSQKESRRLVALWFAIGERRGGFRPTNTTWSAEELDDSSERRYCAKRQPQRERRATPQ